MKTNNGPNTDPVAHPTVLLFFKRCAIQLLSSVFRFANKMRTIYLLFHEIHSGVAYEVRLNGLLYQMLC